jgi:RIO-like serine/threonine protein kinase
MWTVIDEKISVMMVAETNVSLAMGAPLDSLIRIAKLDCQEVINHITDVLKIDVVARKRIKQSNHHIIVALLNVLSYERFVKGHLGIIMRAAP